MVCSNCQQEGHNKTTCSVLIKKKFVLKPKVAEVVEDKPIDPVEAAKRAQDLLACFVPPQRVWSEEEDEWVAAPKPSRWSDTPVPLPAWPSQQVLPHPHGIQKKPCKFGSNCTYVGCRFEHPPDYTKLTKQPDFDPMITFQLACTKLFPMSGDLMIDTMMRDKYATDPTAFTLLHDVHNDKEGRTYFTVTWKLWGKMSCVIHVYGLRIGARFIIHAMNFIQGRCNYNTSWKRTE